LDLDAIWGGGSNGSKDEEGVDMWHHTVTNGDIVAYLCESE